MNDFLTARQAAAYLMVTDTTIQEWVARAQIPCRRQGDQWVFPRLELEIWVDAIQREPRKSPLPQPVRVQDILKPDDVVALATPIKKIALETLVNRMASHSGIANRHELRSEMFRREEQMSTGIGLGMAIPHVRLKSIKHTIMVVGINDQPIEDYGAPDAEPVRILFMIATPAVQHMLYLRIVAALTQMMKNDVLRSSLLRCREMQTAYNLLTFRIAPDFIL